jgi:hypothetical protein
MKKLASLYGFLAIVSSSLPGNAPAVKAQSCNYYAGISVTGQKVNSDTCSISKSSDRSVNFVYYLGDKKFASQANCTDRTWTRPPNKKEIYVPQSQATKKMIDRVCNEQISSNSSAEEKIESTSGERSIAQTSGIVYEDDRIRARAIGASFVAPFAQAALTIENKSGKDLFLAVEFRAVRAISESGETAECALQGIKTYSGAVNPPKPLDFSRLKPKAKISVSVDRCQMTATSKPISLSVTIPLVMLDNEDYSNVTISLNDIPIKQKSKKAGN